MEQLGLALLMHLIRAGLKMLQKEGFVVFMKKACSYFLFLLSVPFMPLKMKSAVESLRGVKDAISFAYSFKCLSFSIKPYQIESEITILLELMRELRPRVVLEIGTASGGTLFLLTRVAQPDAILISIDLPGGAFGGGYSRLRVPMYKAFAKEGQRIYLIRANSHDLATLEKVRLILDDRKVDFLFIDGDHDYEGVKMDFEMYAPLVREKGIVAFHDIVPGSPDKVGGVPRFWKEIKTSYESQEIVEDWKQGGYGIGLIFVSHAINPNL